MLKKAKDTIYMVDAKTLKTLEARQVFLRKRLSLDMDENSFSARELKALNQTMNFMKWMMDNSSDDLVQKVFEKYEQENSNTTDREIEEKDKIEGNTNIKGAFLTGRPNIFHEGGSKRRKIQVVLSENDGVNFIQLELIKRNARLSLWRRVVHIRLTLHSLERIVKKAHALLDGAVPKEQLQLQAQANADPTDEREG
jgi:hypothetical protein